MYPHDSSLNVNAQDSSDESDISSDSYSSFDEQIYSELASDVVRMFEEVFVASPEWLEDFLHVCSSPKHHGSCKSTLFIRDVFETLTRCSVESARFSAGEVVYQYLPQRDVHIHRCGSVYVSSVVQLLHSTFNV